MSCRVRAGVPNGGASPYIESKQLFIGAKVRTLLLSMNFRLKYNHTKFDLQPCKTMLHASVMLDTYKL